jgi:hypothetical protein
MVLELAAWHSQFGIVAFLQAHEVRNDADVYMAAWLTMWLSLRVVMFGDYYLQEALYN